MVAVARKTWRWPNATQARWETTTRDATGRKMNHLCLMTRGRSLKPMFLFGKFRRGAYPPHIIPSLLRRLLPMIPRIGSREADSLYGVPGIPGIDEGSAVS